MNIKGLNSIIENANSYDEFEAIYQILEFLHDNKQLLDSDYKELSDKHYKCLLAFQSTNIGIVMYHM